MIKIVVYHHNPTTRGEIVHTLRSAGHVTYDANDPDQAWAAVKILHPDIVITSYPARLREDVTASTLTERIRLSQEFTHLPVINLDHQPANEAAQAGVTLTVATAGPPSGLLNAVQELAGMRRSYPH